jgi:hypothetical protein
MKLIPLRGKYGQGKFAIVSDKDFNFARSLKLHVSKGGYVKGRYKNRRAKLHQFLVGNYYDHINRDKLDNRRENLRKATQSQNNANKLPKSKSGFKGVSRDEKCKNSWRSGINIKGAWIHLGTFNTPHHAALIYDLWAKDFYGEFAYTNFPIVSGGKVGSD